LFKLKGESFIFSKEGKINKIGQMASLLYKKNGKLLSSIISKQKGGRKGRGRGGKYPNKILDILKI
jgi:hypothetical protein